MSNAKFEQVCIGIVKRHEGGICLCILDEMVQNHFQDEMQVHAACDGAVNRAQGFQLPHTLLRFLVQAHAVERRCANFGERFGDENFLFGQPPFIGDGEVHDPFHMFIMAKRDAKPAPIGGNAVAQVGVCAWVGAKLLGNDGLFVCQNKPPNRTMRGDGAL